MTSFLYAIAQRGGDVKVGISKDPDKRASRMQTGNPMWLSVVMRVPIPEGICPYSVERTVHSLLRPEHVHGEWFCAQGMFVRDLIARAPEMGVIEWINGWCYSIGKPSLVRARS